MQLSQNCLKLKFDPGLDPDFEQPQIKKAKKRCMDQLDDVVVISEEPNVNVQPDIKAVEEFEKYNAEPVSKEDPLVW